MANGRIFSPVLHFDDINGSPLVGGKLYTYEAGTSTPATTYRNAQGTEANENPVVLDGRGECRVYIPEGSLFKLVLKDALENVIWEADYVSAPAHSDNNFTDFDKEKLDGIEEGAQRNVKSDWDATSGDAEILNKPNLDDYAEKSELAEVAFTGDYDDLENRPTIPAPQEQADWAQNNPSAVNFIKNKPALAPVATSGSYNDLNDVPSIPNPQEQSDWEENDASKVSFIKNKPDIPGMAQTTADALCELKANIEAVEADIPPAQVQSDYAQADHNAVDFIRNKPDLSLKEDVANKAVDTIDPTSTTEYPSSKAMANYTDTAIATNSGKYISDNGNPFPSASDLPTDPAIVSHNDYAVVLTGGIYYRYKATVIGGTVSWAMEYAINTNAFTPAQQAAIDSTITAVKVGNYDAHLANTTIHVTQTNKDTWNAKQNAISDLGTIRSGASAGATAVQPATLAEKAEVTAAALCELKENVQGVEEDIPDMTVYAKIADLAAVAFSGDYDDLINKPNLSVYATTSAMNTALAGKQDVIEDLFMIRSGASAGETAVQPATMNTALATKQDTISDLGTIRSGASAGATAVQPGDLAAVATSGSYDDLSNRPNLASVATTGDYNDLNNLPSIPSMRLLHHSQQVSIAAGQYVNPETFNLNAYIPSNSKFYGTLTIERLSNINTSGAYHFVLYVPGNNMTCNFGTYPNARQSGHCIGFSVDNSSSDSQYQLYFKLSGQFEEQNVNVHVDGVIF